jgi:diacylglycerol kinase family enzyme
MLDIREMEMLIWYIRNVAIRPRKLAPACLNGRVGEHEKVNVIQAKWIEVDVDVTGRLTTKWSADPLWVVLGGFCVDDSPYDTAFRPLNFK